MKNTMTEKQSFAFEKIIADIPIEWQEIYREIAEYAVSLGYIPTLKGAQKQYVSFTKSKPNRTILKIVADKKCPPPHIEIKFFGIAPPYSSFFTKAIEDRLSWYDGDNCSNCGKCDGTHGYNYTYPDGKKRFLCGLSLFILPLIRTENVSEIKEAMKKTNDLFMSFYAK